MRDDANDIVARLRDCTCVPHGEICREAAAEIERLRAERDEARRLYCEELAFTIELERGEASDPRDLAEEKKWDCYKEIPNEE